MPDRLRQRLDILDDGSARSNRAWNGGVILLSWLLNLFILYILGVMFAPSLPKGRFRRVLELLYAPLTALGLWYRWSMFSPEVPKYTQIAVTGVKFADGRFEIVTSPGWSDGRNFDNARGPRFIRFQWTLCESHSDYFKPAVCELALRIWKRRNPSETEPPVAVEIRRYTYSSTEPGLPEEDKEPEIQTVWTHRC